MKNLILIIGFFLVTVLQLSGQNLSDKLQLLSENYDFTFKKLETDSLFVEKYLIQFEQPVDHEMPDGDQFTQRIFLSHLNFEAPVLFITEGYDAYYAAHPKYVNELTTMLGANQICVEHRYFGTSTPDSLIWDYLTISNAAADHHNIVELLKNIYSAKWISTGISKGGQTAMYHRYFYPDDVDISVPYVAPLNFSKEDKRVYSFLNQVATAKCRESVYEYQIELLKNKDVYLPEFKKLAKTKKLNYKMGIEKAFELTVFEYSFAFFQWGAWCCDSIPKAGTDPGKMISHLNHIAGIKWISNEGIQELQPFFYQAMREIGFYGYDIEPFKPWTSYQENPTFEFSLPIGISVDYDPQPMQEIDCFIRHKAQNMLFIYGEYDPWSATSVDMTYSTNSIKIVKPGGSHRTRISNLNDDQKKIINDTLNNWLNN